MSKKTTQLKQMLLSDRLEFLMEAHSGLSAKIVEEAGFKGIWGSGLTISSAMGLRDSNEASWTQVLDVMEFMSEASTLPILLDADTGYGNFNNVRRLVRKLEQRDVAGMCLEDKLFPKTNSLIKEGQQPLADIEEFSGKIKAAKDTQQDSDFCVVARIEALIAGRGQEEALKRATAYAEAGADAVLIHSRESTADQILSFVAEWNRPCPVVVVPTRYYKTPTQTFRDAGISLVIWANHIGRACITAMQQTAETIFREQSLLNVEKGIAPVEEVFRLQNISELQAAEKKYLPKKRSESC